MTGEPRRWSESGSDIPDFLRTAIRAERGASHDDQAHVDRVALRLGVLLGPPAAVTVASSTSAAAAKATASAAPKVATAATSWVAKLTSIKVVSTFVIGVAVGSTAVYVGSPSSSSPGTAPSSSTSSMAARGSMSTPRDLPTRQPVSSLASAEPSASVELVAPAEVASGSASAAPTAVAPSVPTSVIASPLGSAPLSASVSRAGEPSAPSLADEARALERAEELLRKDPSAALEAADAHAKQQPSGELAQEREIVAIEALVRLGRRAEASARVDAFAAKFPSSTTHIARARRALSAAPPGSSAEPKNNPKNGPLPAIDVAGEIK
ncbi:MAG: hypothetical protein U0165_17265 [Polyangiaceae bacterium]